MHLPDVAINFNVGSSVCEKAAEAVRFNVKKTATAAIAICHDRLDNQGITAMRSDALWLRLSLVGMKCTIPFMMDSMSKGELFVKRYLAV